MSLEQQPKRVITLQKLYIIILNPTVFIIKKVAECPFMNVKIVIGECLLALQEIETTKSVIDEIRPILGTIVDNKEILARLEK